jgi:SAM-dependent methyltransferase
VAFLADLTPGGRVLELGVGTGRIALPMIGRGFEVWGVDASPEMLQRLKAKPGDENVTTICEDFGTVDAQSGGQFDLVLLLVNTLYAMPTQEHQVACFANAAAHLGPAEADSSSRPGCLTRPEVATASSCGRDGWGVTLPVWSSKSTTRRARSSRPVRSSSQSLDTPAVSPSSIDTPGRPRWI